MKSKTRLTIPLLFTSVLLAACLAARGQTGAGKIRLITREVSLGKLPLIADYVANRAEKPRLVLDGQEGPEVDGIMAGALIFSPDSQRVAYAVRRGGKWSVIIDGAAGCPRQEEPSFVGLGENSLVFSPNSRRLAYAASRGVVDAKTGPKFDAIRNDGCCFSADSWRVAYVARRGDQRWIVVEETESKEYPEVLGHVVFDGPSLIRVMAFRDDASFNRELVRVEIEIVEVQ